MPTSYIYFIKSYWNEQKCKNNKKITKKFLEPPLYLDSTNMWWVLLCHIFQPLSKFHLTPSTRFWLILYRYQQTNCQGQNIIKFEVLCLLNYPRQTTHVKCSLDLIECFACMLCWTWPDTPLISIVMVWLTIHRVFTWKKQHRD